MPIDYDTYMPMLDGAGLGRQESVELIDALHAIVESFVDRALGLDAVQQACGYSALRSGAGRIAAPCSEISITYNEVAADSRKERPS